MNKNLRIIALNKEDAKKEYEFLKDYSNKWRFMIVTKKNLSSIMRQIQ